MAKEDELDKFRKEWKEELFKSNERYKADLPLDSDSIQNKALPASSNIGHDIETQKSSREEDGVCLESSNVSTKTYNPFILADEFLRQCTDGTESSNSLFTPSSKRNFSSEEDSVDRPSKVKKTDDHGTANSSSEKHDESFLDIFLADLV